PPRRLRRLQTLESVLADRLQHPEALVRVPEEALLHQRLERVQLGTSDLFRRLVGAAAGEDAQAGEETPLVLREQVVGPLNRRPERLLTRLSASAAFQQVQALGQALEDLGRREHARASGGQLDRQR